MATRTLTVSQERAARPDRSSGPCLIAVLNGARLTAPPAAVGLARLDQLVVGRGDLRAFDRDTVGGIRRGRLTVDDAWMSGHHFRVERDGTGSWYAGDAGSKNGVAVNGVPCTQHCLEDGDLISAGRSLFLFRERGPTRDWLELPVAAVDHPDHLDSLSAPLRRDIGSLSELAPSKLPVLLYGDSGAGKEVAARFVHAESGRRGRFVAVNCGALPTTLVASELFGAVRGAYSGAATDREGLVRAADGGTLFLDEIAELPLDAQATLLRVLQEQEVTPLGATRSTGVDIRIIAATHRDLRAAVKAGAFRRDLYARLRGREVTLPRVRDRREDIGLLVGRLLRRELGAAADRVHMRAAAARQLLAHDWSFNVRELCQALTYALARCGDGAIRAEHLPPSLLEDPCDDGTESEPVGDMRAALIEQLRRHGGNVSAVARGLGTSRSQVHRLLARYDLALDVYRESA